MINLLPPEYKEKLLKEEQYKIVLILGIFILLFLVCLILILFSIKIYISGQLEKERIFIEQKQKEIKFSQIKEIELKVESINKNLLELDSFYQNQMDITGLFEEISGMLPPGVYLTNFSLVLSTKKDYKFLVSLSGFSPTRGVLYEFKKTLETKKEFKDPYFPPSNWTKSVNIDFNLNFKI